MSSILPWFALAFSLIAVVIAYFAVVIAYRQQVSSVSLRKLTALEMEMTELTDSNELVRAGLTKLRARINARAWNAENRKPAEPEEDLTTEAGRTIARQKLEAELAANGRLHA